jgi:hypothetical protein
MCVIGDVCLLPERSLSRSAKVSFFLQLAKRLARKMPRKYRRTGICGAFCLVVSENSRTFAH